MRRTLAILLALPLLACQPVNRDTVPVDEDLWPVLLADGADLTRQLALDTDGLGFVTPVVDAGGATFNRVAFRFDANHEPAVDVSVSHDDGLTWSSWTEATVTYRDGIAFNAHADVPEGATHAQLRFRVGGPEDIRFLAVDLVQFDPELVEALIEPEVELDTSPYGTLQSALAATGNAVLRADWGARASRCSSRHTPNKMAVHHTVTPNNDSYDMPRRVRQIQAYHMDSRGWCDVGYHFLIGQDGRVYQARVETYIGAHVANHNTGNAGISFIGDFTSIVPSSSMMDAGARIIRALSSEYGIAINRTKILGHREHSGASTACPGNSFYPKLGDLVSLAANGGGGTNPGGTTGTLKGAIFYGTDFSTDLSDMSKRLSGATVSLSNGSSTTTDAEGWYTFDVAAGSYTITASKSGYSTGTDSKSVTAGTTTWGSIMLSAQGGASNGTVKGVVFWGNDASDFSANVSDPSKRLSGATVTFSPGGKTATTGADGYYEISLSPGTYNITASATGYTDGQRPDPVTVTAGELSWGSTMVIKPAGGTDTAAPQISIASPTDGAAVDVPEIAVVGSVADQSAIASLTVNGTPTAMAGTGFNTTVTLQPGANTITVEATDSAGNQGSASVTVTYLGDESSGVTGFVYDHAAGQTARVGGATVELVGSVAHEVTTDAAGAFSVDLEPGGYTLTVRAEGFADFQSAIQVAAGARTRLEIGLREPGSVAAPTGAQITFPADGDLFKKPRILIAGVITDSAVARVTVNGTDAAMSGEEFSALWVLEKGENVLEAIAYDADGVVVGRHSVTVTLKKGAFGCTSTEGPAAGGLLLVALLGLAFARRRR